MQWYRTGFSILILTKIMANILHLCSAIETDLKYIYYLFLHDTISKIKHSAIHLKMVRRCPLVVLDI